MLRKAATLGVSAMAALVLLPAPALANAPPLLPWDEPVPLQVSLVGLLFVLSAGVALSGWWMLRRVERTARRQAESSVTAVSGTRGKAA
jgi:hypothetical protein